LTQAALLQLTELNGDVAVLEKAANTLPKSAPIQKALAELLDVSQALAGLGVTTSFDLSELRGYHYHSGIVFAAYAKGFKGPLALGGRYDEVGQAFGRARPATGFSLDLRGIVTALPPAKAAFAILAPATNVQTAENKISLLQKISALRNDGEIVIQEIEGMPSNPNELNCNKKLAHFSSGWHVVDL